jgi:hypothetical protein
MKFSELLFKLVPGRIPAPTAERLRKVMRQVIGKCPVCDLNLDDHAYAELASVFTTDLAAQADADQAAERRDWDALMLIQQWNPDADVIAYKAIRCSRREELGLLRILFTAELWADDVVRDRQRLNIKESQRLARIIGDRWHPL